MAGNRITVVEIATRHEARQVDWRDRYEWHRMTGLNPANLYPPGPDGEPRFVGLTKPFQRLEVEVQELRRADGRSEFLAVHPDVMELVESVSPRLLAAQKAFSDSQRRLFTVSGERFELQRRIDTFQALPWWKRAYRAIRRTL